MQAPSWHAPLKHVADALAKLQTVGHVPQCAGSVFRFASHPFTTLPSQLPKPALHELSAHTPAEHEALALANEHTVPQPPQFDTLVLVFVSQPFDALASQLPKPALHTGVQRPDTQDVVPFMFAHAVPHAPQLVELVLRFVSQPLFGLPSQLA